MLRPAQHDKLGYLSRSLSYCGDHVTKRTNETNTNLGQTLSVSSHGLSVFLVSRSSACPLVCSSVDCDKYDENDETTKTNTLPKCSSLPHPLVCLSVHPLVRLSARLVVWSSACLFVCLSACLFVLLSL